MKKCLNYRIREVRIKNGLTIQKMADILEIPASSLGMYERGMRNPDITLVMKISKELNVDIEYFYDQKEELTEIASNIEKIQGDRVVEEAKKRAKGFCELCERRAPFILDNGEPYLEIQEISSKMLNDSTVAIVMLCPNCKKKLQILNRTGDINYLLRKVRNESNER